MTAKRRFNKAACKRLAAEVRSEVGLDPMDPLDPWQLAHLYGIEVIALSQLAVPDDVRNHFALTHQDLFSGALVPIGSGAAIIENDSHSITRRRSTMGHELAHVIGEHEFGTSLVNERGCRLTDQAQEEEAAEISGELLVPFEAAKRLARRSASDEAVAFQFGVSVSLARWRMNSTGARLIARRGSMLHQRARRA